MEDELDQLVLAMQINDKTAYNYYLELPAPRHHSYTDMLGHYVVLRPGQDPVWSWMEKEIFEANYKPAEHPSIFNFTYYTLEK